MPTAAELQIVITAQDQASARLRELGQDVQRIERQVESAGGAFGRLGGAIGGLGQIGLAAGGIGAVVSGFQSAFDAVGGVVQQASDLNADKCSAAPPKGKCLKSRSTASASSCISWTTCRTSSCATSPASRFRWGR